MKMKSLAVYFGIILMLLAAGCSRKTETIKIAGSNTMFKMSQECAKEFMYIYRDTNIEIKSCTDDEAIASLINNECAAAMTTRGIKKDEFELAKKNSKNLLQFIIGLQNIEKPEPSRKLLVLYTDSKPKGSVKKYISFVLGAHGQNIVKNSGFVPIKK
ncbi:MAG: substrate-binding domain-containing protein [Elusimicrobiota bacterium]|nr:hypothetical protein [Elusimicrobiota bacterium]